MNYLERETSVANSARWQPAPEKPTILTIDNEIHVWLVNLDTMQFDPTILNEDEIKRANRMHFTVDQTRTRAARAILRTLLSYYLPQTAASFVFQTTAQGKLFLPDDILKFNLAHTKQMAVYAFTLNHEVGVDLERQREKMDFTNVAKRFMGTTEYDYWSQLTPEFQIELFFKIWARKEALVKCTGEGLSGPLRELNSIDAHGELCQQIPYPTLTNVTLQLQDLPTINEFYGALAIDTTQPIKSYFYKLN